MSYSPYPFHFTFQLHPICYYRPLSFPFTFSHSSSTIHHILHHSIITTPTVFFSLSNLYSPYTFHFMASIHQPFSLPLPSQPPIFIHSQRAEPSLGTCSLPVITFFFHLTTYIPLTVLSLPALLTFPSLSIYPSPTHITSHHYLDLITSHCFPLHTSTYTHPFPTLPTPLSFLLLFPNYSPPFS